MEQTTNEAGALYSRQVLDFVTIATEFCRCLEQTAEQERERFCGVMRGLLPMLYLKATLLPEVDAPEGYNAPSVTEDDYDFVRHNVAALLADADDYLDVFVDDFKYSDAPVLCTVSENLADIYQVLRDLVEVFRAGHEEAMAVALQEARDSFGTGWGAKTLGALRALHDARFGGLRRDDF